MPRLLLIEPDRERRRLLERALVDAELTDLSAVPSGSFALTMLERDRPDVIVSRARVPDIDGFELCSIVRSDPALAGVRFLLLAGAEDREVAAEFDLADRVLVGDVAVEAVVAEVQALLAGVAPPAPALPETAGAETGRGLRGSLEVMDLAEVAQAIALGAKTGDLVVTLPDGEGRLIFDRGRIVHAEFLDLAGEPAFTALLVAAHRRGGGSFCFNPLDRLAPDVERTITRSVDSLLLNTAADIDEGRAGTAARVSAT